MSTKHEEITNATTADQERIRELFSVDPEKFYPPAPPPWTEEKPEPTCYSSTTRLPTDSKARKEIPLWSGLVEYFPDALIAVAQVSYAGSKQHHPDKPLHWDRSKSTDQKDTLLRHLWESGTIDIDGQRHSAKVCWRALALLQLEIEAER